MRLILLIVAILSCTQCFLAQANCSGTTLFTESKCAGDEVSPTEKELFKIINDYRAQNNLPPVTLSEPLSMVANRHILDLTINVKYLTHGWSNCPYDIKDQGSWNCLFESPRRLNSSYPGNGFENLYRNLSGSATPGLALEAWKKSQLHNGLILNLDAFKSINFDAFGVAVSGNYAAIWFGAGASQQVNLKTDVKSLGISFGKLVEGLTTVLSIQKESSLGDSEKWVGKSADNTIKLEIYGIEQDITETTMSFTVRLDKKGGTITPQGRSAFGQFLKNLAPNWAMREKWIDTTLQKLSKTPKVAQTIDLGKRTVEVSINAENYLQVLVKPNLKPQPKEFF